MAPGTVKLRESLQQSWRIYLVLSAFISPSFQWLIRFCFFIAELPGDRSVPKKVLLRPLSREEGKFHVGFRGFERKQ